jgi:pimeloyl-ACP methyl ester carboxylesterase
MHRNRYVLGLKTIVNTTLLVAMPSHLEQMAARHPNMRLLFLDGGHVVHVDNPAGFTEEVKAFLQDPQRFVRRRDQ